MRSVWLAGLLMAAGCTPDQPVMPSDFADAAVMAVTDATVSAGTDTVADLTDVHDTVDAQPDVHADLLDQPDSSPDVGADVQPDLTPDAAVKDATPDVGVDVQPTPDAQPDASMDGCSGVTCAQCPTPGTSDGCGTKTCFARSTAGGGNICLADVLDPTWPFPFPTSHPATDFTLSTEYVTDKLTGLSWAKEALVPQNWPTALTACIAKSYGGFVDWRLPTTRELITLYDSAEIQPASAAPDLSWGLYYPTYPATFLFWSGLPWDSGGVAGWYVDFNHTYSYYFGTTPNRVRCVR